MDYPKLILGHIGQGDRRTLIAHTTKEDLKMKLTRKQQEIFNQLQQERGENLDKQFLNIAAFLVAFRLTECNDINDLYIIYDNLWINSEILDTYTIEYYEPQDIERRTGHNYKTIKKNIEKDYIYLLDYYSIKNGRDHLVNCFIKLDANYNIF